MTSLICNAVTNGIAMRELTDTWLALHRYRLKHRELPLSLDQLVPDFLPQVPLDPFAGKPLRFQRDKGSVYSIGRNRVDDGGQMNVDTWEPDIVVEVKGRP